MISKPLRPKKRRVNVVDVHDNDVGVDGDAASEAKAELQEEHEGDGRDAAACTANADNEEVDGERHNERPISESEPKAQASVVEEASEERAEEEEEKQEEQEEDDEEEQEVDDSDSSLELVTDTDPDVIDGHGGTSAKSHTAAVLQFAIDNGCDLECAEDALEMLDSDSTPNDKADTSFVETSSQDQIWGGSQDQDWKPARSQPMGSSDDSVFSSDDKVDADLTVLMKFSPPHQGKRERGVKKSGHLQDCSNKRHDTVCMLPAHNRASVTKGDLVPSCAQGTRCLDTNDDGSSDDFVYTVRRCRGRGAKAQKKMPKTSQIPLEEWVSELLNDSTREEDAFCLQHARCDSDIVRRTPYKNGSCQGRMRPKYERTAAVRLLELPFPYDLLNGKRGRIRHVVSPEPHTANLRRATQNVRSIHWVRTNEGKPAFAYCFLIDVFEWTNELPTIAILVQQKHLVLVNPHPRLSRAEKHKFKPAELPHWG